jgi:RNA polymerase sigma factor (sigma-70 family)
VSEISNPLLSSSPHAWNRLIEAVEPASLLLVIEQRMSPALRTNVAAEDILQDALLHAWRDRRQLVWRGTKSFRSWLLTIIDHRIHDAADRDGAAKRGGGRAAVQLGGTGGLDATSTSGEAGYPAVTTTPSRLAMYREQAEVMKRALEALSEEYREVVRLRVFEQTPLEEIAERLGIGVSAVRHRFRKGAEIYARSLRSALGSRPGSPAPESGTDSSRESSPR